MPRPVSAGRASTTGSTMIRRQLGRRLRDLRVASGRTQEDVAMMKIMSLTKLKQIEYGRQYVKPGDAYELGRIYGADTEELERLRELATATGEPGWWQEGRDTDGLTKGFDTYLDLEASASVLSLYQPLLVNGLVQTADYARAIDTATAIPSATEKDIARSVNLRTQRLPNLLKRQRPPRIEVVLGEAALRLKVGDAQVMQEQRRHLLAVGALDNVTIKVLLLDRGPHLGLLGAFTVLDFDNPDDPSVTVVETYGGARYDDRTDPVERHQTVFRAVHDLAVTLEEYLDEQ